MVAPVEDICPLCGQMHMLPDARSDDPVEMGCYTDILYGIGELLDPVFIQLSQKGRAPAIVEPSLEDDPDPVGRRDFSLGS